MLRIGICGGGIAGLSTAIALRAVGHDVDVFEQSSQFGQVGSDINLTPNSVFALDGLGVGEYLRRTAARPTYRISRNGITGEETSRLPMSDAAEERYGAPQLTMHRGDLLSALKGQLPDKCIHFGMTVEHVELMTSSSAIKFKDGTKRIFDLVIGADGIHSAVRRSLFGSDSPKFTGMVSYRAAFPRERVAMLHNLDAFTKWWGEVPAKQIVTFPLSLGREIFVFATIPQEDLTEEGWTLPGDAQDLRDAYRNFHPDARALLDAIDQVLRSALHVREPMKQWFKGRAVVIGDAAHPMAPFMAQGAAMAIEDSVVLARCLENAMGDDIERALTNFERARMPRTAEIQRGSLANEWLKGQGNADWVYGYNAWDVAVKV